jgi:methionine synthase I (cobalamin-dependent)
MPVALRELFERGGVILDGGLGSMLIAAGLEAGSPPEEWNHTNPDALTRIHASYLAAGSDVISTNTFGATPARLKDHGLGDQLRSINTAGVRLARDAIARFREGREDENRRQGSGNEGTDARFVALSIGPTGKMLPPVGAASEEEVKAEFTGQFRSIEDDVDLVLIETIFDLREGLIALEAAKDIFRHPVAVSLTCNKNPRGFFTVMGDEAGAAVKQLQAAGADIVGANCSLASGDMLELAEVLRQSTELPVLCQPNAGNPTVENRVPVYNQRPEEFAGEAMKLFEKGINAVGGCCGTTPDFIRELYARLRPGTPKPESAEGL